MDIKFVVDDCVLIWNILFGPSVSDSIYKSKQKLWLNYKNEYNNLYKEKNIILNDAKNYIPNDDTIFNIILESDEYKDIKASTEKYRMQITSLWTKKVFKNLKEILKTNFEPYTVYLIDDALDVIDSSAVKDNNVIVFGKKIPAESSYKIVLDIANAILHREASKNNEVDTKIVSAIIELALYNELATRLTTKSCYFLGEQSLTPIKRQLYPYWLMYLGIEKNNMAKYMLRDKIAFDVDKFPYEKKLKELDILEFIGFVIRNKRYLVKEEQEEII